MTVLEGDLILQGRQSVDSVRYIMPTVLQHSNLIYLATVLFQGSVISRIYVFLLLHLI